MKRSLEWLALALVIAGVGCSETTIERGVCGNGLVEDGEDCDTDAEGCDACRLTCELGETDCSEYDGAVGFVCGNDGFCHAPAGRFEPFSGDLAMPVTTYEISDVDLDFAGDILVQAPSSLSVVFGTDIAGGFTRASVVTPTALGAATFTDLDFGGGRTVLMPTADGIIAYASQSGIPSPFPFPQSVGDGLGQPLYVNPIRDQIMGTIGTFPGTELLSFAALDVGPTPPNLLGGGELCGFSAQAFVPDQVDVFEVSPLQRLVALTVEPPGQEPALCVVSVTENTLAEPDALDRFVIAPVAFVPDAPPSSRPVLVDLGQVGCPSLVVAEGNSVVVYDAKISPCGFAPGGRTLNAPPGAEPIGAVPLVPRLAGAAPDAIALTTGLYAFRTAQPTTPLAEIYRSDRRLAQVRAADLDRDGDLDVVASGDRAQALDILYRLPQGYLPLRVATDGTVTMFLVGDYDGNTMPDVAYVERGAFDIEQLTIAYGTRDGLLPGAIVGAFGTVLSLIPSQLEDSTDRFGAVDDLVVLFNLFGPVQLTILHGSPSRTMLAFFDPRPPPVSARSVFRGVAAGNFGGGFSDVLAIEQDDLETHLWLSSGAEGGTLSSIQQPIVTISDVQMCKAGVGPGDAGAPFCLDNARFAAWPTGEGEDIVVSFDQKHELLMLDPRPIRFGGDPIVERFPSPLVAPPNTEVRALRVVGDRFAGLGAARLVVALGPTADASEPRLAAAANLCTFEGSGPRCVDLGARIAELTGDTVTCVDAGYTFVAPARRFVPPDTNLPELVVLCHLTKGAGTTDDPVFSTGTDRLYRLPLDLAYAKPLGDLLAEHDALEIGDVTGDQIPDLVLLDRASSVLRVFRQCTASELRCNDFVELPVDMLGER